MTKEFKKSFRYCYNLFLFCEKYIIIVSNKRVQMFSKQQIIDTLNSEDLFLDNFLLEAFIKNWKIEPIYEDAQGVEFFDEMAVEKIRNGLKQKEPKTEINIIDKDEIKPVDIAVEVSEEATEPEPVSPQEETFEYNEIPETPEPQGENREETEPAEANYVQELPVTIINEVNKEVENELKNITLDISNQTLAVLAESIARKITSDVSEFIKRTDFIEDAVQLGEYKKDNQLLVEKIDELVADNKALIKKIEELEKDSNSFVKLFGNVYIKNP